MNKSINVLSLFDGMSCGQIALERAQLPVNKYYASEIDKYAMKVTQANYPGTIQLGNIEGWKKWDPVQPDIIMGGSPCQGFSFAGKGLNFDDPRSKLFFTFIDILKHYKPKYFLLENVVMDKKCNDIISEILGELYPECVEQKELFRTGRLEPEKINSALVSAQNRERLYWSNIPSSGPPKDKKIYLKDIIEDGEVYRYKSYCIDAHYFNIGNNQKTMSKTYFERGKRQIVKCGRITGRPVGNHKSRVPGQDTEQILEVREDEKTNCLSTVQKDNVVVYDRCLQIGEADIKGFDSIKRVYSINGKSPSILSNSGGNRETKISTDNIHYRKLTPMECERLQTVPDNYTNHVSNSRRYHMIGNGWTIDIIVHKLKGITL